MPSQLHEMCSNEAAFKPWPPPGSPVVCLNIWDEAETCLQHYQCWRALRLCIFPSAFLACTTTGLCFSGLHRCGVLFDWLFCSFGELRCLELMALLSPFRLWWKQNPEQDFPLEITLVEIEIKGIVHPKMKMYSLHHLFFSFKNKLLATITVTSVMSWWND